MLCSEHTHCWATASESSSSLSDGDVARQGNAGHGRREEVAAEAVVLASGVRVRAVILGASGDAIVGRAGHRVVRAGDAVALRNAAGVRRTA